MLPTSYPRADKKIIMYATIQEILIMANAWKWPGTFMIMIIMPGTGSDWLLSIFKYDAYYLLKLMRLMSQSCIKYRARGVLAFKLVKQVPLVQQAFTVNQELFVGDLSSRFTGFS